MSTEPQEVQTIDPAPVVEAVQEVKQDSATETAQNVEAAKPDDKKPNRTGEFIDKLKKENWELRQMKAELDALKASLPKPEAPKAPDPNTFFNDPIAFVQASNAHSVQEARQSWEQEQVAQRQREEQERVAAGFREKSKAFAAEHEDFEEVIFSVPPDLLPEDLASNIIGHERGVELAYHLGKNLGELAQLASVAPQYQRYAIDALASRLDGESRTTAPPPEVPNPVAVQQQPPKPISQAPAPAPRVGGRTPTEVPAEKMTDDEWYKQDQERRRKR